MAQYAGMVMILNTAVQFLLLLGTNRLCQHPPQWLQMLLGSAIGGLYAGLCLLSGFVFLSRSLYHFIVFAVIALVAFGVNAEALRRGAVFVLLNMALEGITVGIGSEDYWHCIPAVAMLGVLCAVGFYEKRRSSSYLPVEISYGGKRVLVTALQDTGNMLTDPLTGQQVLVVGPNIAGQIVGLTRQQLKSPLDAIVNSHISGLRLIPYRTVGQGSAFLLALRMGVKMGNKEGNSLVAFAPEDFGQGSTYQALTGGTF